MSAKKDDLENDGHLLVVPNPRDLALGLSDSELDKALVPTEDPKEGSKLYELVDAQADGRAILDQAMRDAAEQVAYMQKAVKDSYAAGGNFASISEKALKGLRTVVDLAGTRDKELAEFMKGEVDFHSEGFRNVIAYFIHLVRESLTSSGIPAPQAKTFFICLQSSMQGFEEKSERLYKGASLEDVMTADFQDRKQI